MDIFKNVQFSTFQKSFQKKKKKRNFQKNYIYVEKFIYKKKEKKQ